MYLFVLRDCVAGESGPIFEAKNEDVAKRKVMSFFKDSEVYPADFSLIQLGEINHETDALISTYVDLGNVEDLLVSDLEVRENG